MERHQVDLDDSVALARSSATATTPAGDRLPQREPGRAWDYENNGMVGAVSHDDGRVKLYCVDSFDASWPTGRSRSRSGPGATAYQSSGSPTRSRRTSAPTAAVRTSHGLLDGAASAHSGAACRPVPGRDLHVGDYDPSTWLGWGERGDAAYFRRPDRLRPAPARRDHLELAAVTAARRADRGRGGLGERKSDRVSPGCPVGISHELNEIVGGTMLRTTGRGGAHKSPTTCRASADVSIGSLVAWTVAFVLLGLRGDSLRRTPRAQADRPPPAALLLM